MTQYYGMRALSAVLGSAIIPLVYGTVETMTRSKNAAFVTSLLLIFDSGLITLSQYILLDPILLFFMVVSVFFTVKFASLNRSQYGVVSVRGGQNEFSLCWWFHLAMSGVSLGCMLAVKWVGLFTVVFIGVWTINDLWNLLGCVKVTMLAFLKHFLARVICLIILPFTVYCGVFAIHYEVLKNSGMVDGHHSSVFQSCLKGNELHNASLPLQVAYGSIVTLKHHRITASGYLHSHDKVYPLEVMPNPHQQVTLYFHKDENNYWEVIKPYSNELQIVDKNFPNNGMNVDTKKTDYLEDGSVVRLKHALTGHHLYSHSQSAPLSPRQQIVSAHNHSSSDEKLNGLWKVQVANGRAKKSGIQILTTFLHFVHVNTGCLLLTSMKMLPKWGGNQFEVTCSHHRRDKSYAVWNFEYHINKHVPESKIEPCDMSFMQRIVESHLVMATFNSGLKPDEGERTSKAWHWPINYKGQPFSRMGDNDHRVYLLGNPLIFFLNFLVIILFCLLAVAYRILELRNLPGLAKSRRQKAQEGDPLGGGVVPRLGTRLYGVETVAHLARNFNASKWFLLAWAFHYLPFYSMSRILYFHHYYPAFIFSCCLTGCFVEFVFKAASIHLASILEAFMPFWTVRRVNNGLMILFVGAILQSFYLYSPLCYGMTGPYSHDGNAVMRGLKIFSHWEI